MFYKNPLTNKLPEIAINQILQKTIERLGLLICIMRILFSIPGTQPQRKKQTGLITHNER